MTAGEIEPFMTSSAPDVVCVVGSSGPMVGKDALRGALEQLYGISRSIRHEVISEWVFGNEIIVEAVAHYDRMSDGKHIPLPSVTIVAVNGDGLVTSWGAYVDPGPLFAPGS
jgi:hypothetical protein